MLRYHAGLAVFVAILLLDGCNQPPHRASVRPPPATAPVPASAPAPIAAIPPTAGRFRIVFSPLERSDTFLLDSVTGRVWQMTQMTDLKGQPTVWKHMVRLDTNADDYVFAQEHKLERRNTEAQPAYTRRSRSRYRP